MKKREIPFEEAAMHLLKSLRGGVLVTTKADDKVNTMTIGWGSIGYEWSEPMFTAYIRESRYTAELLNKNAEFSVNIPDEHTDKKILGYAGSHSGRDEDKIKNLNLTLVEGEKISVPAIKELPITIECRIVQRELQDLNTLDEEYREKYYPEDVPSSYTGANRDAHIAFIGEILSAYIIEE